MERTEPELIKYYIFMYQDEYFIIKNNFMATFARLSDFYNISPQAIIETPSILNSVEKIRFKFTDIVENKSLTLINFEKNFEYCIMEFYTRNNFNMVEVELTKEGFELWKELNLD